MSNTSILHEVVQVPIDELRTEGVCSLMKNGPVPIICCRMSNPPSASVGYTSNCPAGCENTENQFNWCNASSDTT